MVTPNMSTDAISTNRIIDTKMRDRKENLLNKGLVFHSKLANITPKKVFGKNHKQVQSHESSSS